MAEEKPLIYKSIIEVMKKVNAISKGRKNQQQGFSFRGIDDVMNELHATLAECGVFVVPCVLDEQRTTGKTKNGSDMFYTRQRISFTFYAEDGSHIDAVVIGEAMDTGDKASNKALSIGLKYALLQVFCIPTEEEKDPDANSPQPKAGTMQPPKKQLPPAVETTKNSFNGKVYAGGETTPAEREELKKLMSSEYPNGARVFTKEEALAYSALRETMTAAEVIAKVKADLAARTPTQTAGDLMRQQQESDRPNFDIF